MKELLNDPIIRTLLIQLGIAIIAGIIGKFDKKNIATKLLRKIADKLETK